MVGGPRNPDITAIRINLSSLSKELDLCRDDKLECETHNSYNRLLPTNTCKEKSVLTSQFFKDQAR